MLAGSAAPAVPASAATAETQTYIVLYKANGVSQASLAKLEGTGATLVKSYPQIGVAIVKSDRVGFGQALKSADTAVLGAASTAAFGVAIENDAATDAAATIDPGTPAPGNDNLAALQWDMDQIQAAAARAINGGSPSVVVGDIDTGLDWTHPDLRPTWTSPRAPRVSPA